VVNPQGPLQGVQVVGNGAEKADLAFRLVLGNGDGDGVFVDIEAEVEFIGFYGVVVSSHSHDESERIRRLCGGDVRAALPTRATRNPNKRQPHCLHQPFNSRLAVVRQP
jgi:hypothetical protein